MRPLRLWLVVALTLSLSACGGTTSNKAPSDGKPTEALDKAKEDAAQAQARVIAQAVKTYRLNHDTYPNDVSMLTQPDPANKNKPYIAADGIKDPWGQVYQIDPAGPNHKGQEADVFTTSPGGKKIGNWK
jgi:type II secretory pathway pseudopilin PulG